MSFYDKVVIVTGASSGIGAAIAIKFAKEQAQVAIVGRNETRLQDVAQSCEKIGRKPLAIIADISKDSDAKRIVDETVKHFGKLDILINNAGFVIFHSILDKNYMEVFDNIVSTNLRAAVYIAKQAVSHIIETKGNIINISSVGAKKVVPLLSSYNTSKAGLDHFTRCLALELAPSGVRVNAISPGPVLTGIVAPEGIKLDDIRENFKDITPLGRISEPEEIADLALYLASNKAKGITGSILVSDNGMMLK